ncbi:MAG: hypothetical protein ABW185_05630 [Sedimenticola sp.]
MSSENPEFTPDSFSVMPDCSKVIILKPFIVHRYCLEEYTILLWITQYQYAIGRDKKHFHSSVKAVEDSCANHTSSVAHREHRIS